MQPMQRKAQALLAPSLVAFDKREAVVNSAYPDAGRCAVISDVQLFTGAARPAA
jgi:hypothetical protein